MKENSMSHKIIVRKGEINADELVGPSRAGKSTLYKKMIKDYESRIEFSKFSKTKKMKYLFKFLLTKPILSIYLLYKTNTNFLKLKHMKTKDYYEIFKMKNSYISAVMSKYEAIRKVKGKILVDEFLLQSIFMMLHNKSNEKEIRTIVERLPKTNRVIIVEEKFDKRYERLKRVKKLARDINLDYRIEWWKTTDYNLKILKKILAKG